MLAYTQVIVPLNTTDAISLKRLLHLGKANLTPE